MELTPYIIFNGQCQEALQFYTAALGGTVQNLSLYEDAPQQSDMGADKSKVMHAQFAVEGRVLFMASDDGRPDAQPEKNGMVNLSLNFTDAGSIDNTFAKLSEGGTVTMPLQDTFWGARFGMLTDRFGLKWMFNYDKPKE